MMPFRTYLVENVGMPPARYPHVLRWLVYFEQYLRQARSDAARLSPGSRVGSSGAAAQRSSCAPGSARMSPYGPSQHGATARPSAPRPSGTEPVHGRFPTGSTAAPLGPQLPPRGGAGAAPGQRLSAGERTVPGGKAASTPDPRAAPSGTTRGPPGWRPQARPTTPGPADSGERYRLGSGGGCPLLDPGGFRRAHGGAIPRVPRYPGTNRGRCSRRRAPCRSTRTTFRGSPAR